MPTIDLGLTVFPEPLIWLSYVAAATSTLRLATGVLAVPESQPVLAKQLATLDHHSGGRTVLGAGIDPASSVAPYRDDVMGKG